MRGTTTTNVWSMSTVFLLSYFVHAFGSRSCPGLECWYLNEKVARGDLTAPPSQEKSLLHIRAEGHHAASLEDLADPSFLRVYAVSDVKYLMRPPLRETLTKLVTNETPDAEFRTEEDLWVRDPAATLCHRSRKGSARKPHCELSRIQPQFYTPTWAASLADGLSPLYLQADWFSAAVQDLEGRHGTSSILRAATGTNELDVVLSVTSSTLVVQSRLGEPVLLDCQFWTNTASPLCGSGFAVEWRYQYRGDGRLLLSYDGKSDRLSDSPEEGAMLDFEGLHRKGNASLVLQEAQVHHSGMYICMVYLPHILAQVTIELEIAEPPSLSIHPSSLPVTAPGQILTVHCEASGFAPHSLELNWQWKGPDGKTRSLGPGRLTGHRQAWNGTYSQDTRLELDTSDPELGGGGELTCVAEHPGGTRRASVALRVIGFSTPSIEDSMVMVGVALVLYGLIKFVSWTFLPTGSTDAEETDKKEK